MNKHIIQISDDFDVIPNGPNSHKESPDTSS